MQTYNIQTAPFQELTATPTALAANLSFDIIIDEEISLTNYCNALFKKIFELPQSQFPDFINYQCNKVKDAFSWINKLEKLIALNEEVFDNQKAKSRYIKLYNIIEHKRKEIQTTAVKEEKNKTPKKYINAENEERIFSFHETKTYINTLNNDNEKILYLMNECFEYKQATLEMINQKLQNYEVQCRNEIERIQTLQKFQSDFKQQSPSNNGQHTKLKLNCNLNVFVDVFYQMQTQLKEKGNPYLEATTQEIAAFVANNFIDKENQPISVNTIRTILTPSKSQKRPNSDKRIQINQAF